MNTFKATLKGNLDFGIPKTYDMMTAHFLRRLELYYKNDYALKGIEFFEPDTFSLVVPRMTIECSEKTWKNTIGLFRELRGFAIAGYLDIFVTDMNNQLVMEETIVPQGDKVATTEYLRGVSFLTKPGKEDKAIESFTKAIEKYNRYAQAYERRGTAYLRMGKTEDALMDFSKSLSISPNPEAYFGLAETKRKMGDLTGAIADLTLALKNAVPFQPIFWMSRRVKGEIHLQLNQSNEAAFEFKYFTKRAFKDTDPNLPHRAKAWSMYATALELTGDKKAAIEAALQAKSQGYTPEKVEILRGGIEIPKAVKMPKGTAVAMSN